MDNQPLYSLTRMTGQEASSTRTVVVGVVDVPWRALVVSIAALLTALPIMAVLWSLVGSLAVLFPFAWIAFCLWLFHGRTRRGLRVHNYVRLLNRRRAVLNQFLLGPATVEVPHRDWRIIAPGSRPNPALQVRPEQLTAVEARRHPTSVVEAVFARDDGQPDRRRSLLRAARQHPGAALDRAARVTTRVMLKRDAAQPGVPKPGETQR